MKNGLGRTLQCALIEIVQVISSHTNKAGVEKGTLHYIVSAARVELSSSVHIRVGSYCIQSMRGRVCEEY